ncbi:MAG: 16S rRNA (cytidine(1402)-2'-O)-methyltransferase [Elusimicrobiota bacterium]
MLYIVPTPVGNLEDASARCLRVLREAKAVYCEDTRRTLKLLSHHGIHTPVLRYRDRDPRLVDAILERLRRGEDLALASDSGTPVISDPGLDLVSKAREEGVPVCSIPGPCAAVSALAGSGLPGGSFVFLGFLPRSRSKQVKEISAAAALGMSLVVYESPFRVLDLLEVAEEVLGPDSRVAVCRELSKVHEEWLTGTVASVRKTLRERNELLGEFVLVFHPMSPP